MRRAGDGGFVLLATVVWVVGASAQEPEDWSSAAADLEAVDQPLTVAELAALLADAPGAPQRSWHAAVRAMTQRDRYGALGRELRLAAGGPAWDLRARWRETTAGARLTAVAAELVTGPLRCRIGGFSWRQGFGLLAGRPGRRGSLTADSGLGAGGVGFGGWTGWPEARAMRGAALTLTSGNWRWEGGVGQRETTIATKPLLMAAVGRASDAWRVGVVAAGQGCGAVAACGRWRRGAWYGSWEGLGRREGGRTTTAAVLQTGWRSGRAVRAEMLAVLAEGPTGVLAPGHALLGGDAGAGWAARAVWLPAPGTSLRVLWAKARRESPVVAGPRTVTTLETLAALRLRDGLGLHLRLRRTAGEHLVWSVAQPWVRPATVPNPGRTTMSARLVGGTRVLAWRLELRTCVVEHATTAGQRNLVRLVASGRDDHWRWQVAWRQAWGEPVDLVTAVASLPGRIEARHWGRWDGGWFLATGVVRGGGAIDGAVDLRRQTADGRVVCEFWGVMRIRW